MTSSTSRRSRPIHIHGAELSTDQDTIGTYAETIAMLVALVALLAAAWAVATPSSGAELSVPAARPAPVPAVYDVSRTANATADVVWPDAFDAPAATAVTVVPGPASVPVGPETATLGPDLG